MAESTLVQQIMQEVSKLDDHQQEDVLEYIQTINPEPFDWDEWLRGADALREEIRAKHGDDHFANVVELIEEMREERLNDILDSL